MVSFGDGFAITFEQYCWSDVIHARIRPSRRSRVETVKHIFTSLVDSPKVGCWTTIHCHHHWKMTAHSKRWEWPEKFKKVSSLSMRPKQQLFWNLYVEACGSASIDPGDCVEMFAGTIIYPRVNSENLSKLGTGMSHWSSDLLNLLLWWLVADANATVKEVCDRQNNGNWFPLFLPLRKVPYRTLLKYWNRLINLYSDAGCESWSKAMKDLQTTLPATAKRFPTYWEFLSHEASE